MRRFYQIAMMFGLLLASTALADQDIEVIPGEYDFGVVELGSKASAVIELKNVGDRVLRLDNIQLLEEDGEDFKITSLLFLPIFYGAGGSFYVELEYTPSKSGKSLAKLKVISSDPDESEVDVPLQGESPSEELNPAEQIAVILDFYAQSVADNTLVGSGNGKSAGNRLDTFGNMLEVLQKQIEKDAEDALEKAESVYLKADGLSLPPDFVTGPAKEELAAMLAELKEALAAQ